MKVPSILCATLALALSPLAAGPVGGGKTTMAPVPAPQPSGCDCFGPGFTVNPYGLYMIPEGEYDEEFGGGVSLDYFFTRFVGVSGFAQWVATDSVTHNYGADLVLRYPIDSLCVAPYVLGGVGVHTNSETEFIGRLGAGIDWRIKDCIGVFADWTYTLPGGELEDYQIIRLGMKFPF